LDDQKKMSSFGTSIDSKNAHAFILCNITLLLVFNLILYLFYEDYIQPEATSINKLTPKFLLIDV
jgi:hypothetical protein